MRVRGLCSVLVVLLVVALAAPATATLPTPAAPQGCSRASLGAATAELVHPGAELVDVTTVAGLESALVLEPLIAPGTRRRLLRAGDLWCGIEGFNTAWAASGRRAGTAEQAAAFASVAAAPYFDGVTVQRAVARAGGIVTVDTHARTNGVTATWTVLVDGQGVRTASWTATGFAVRPFEAEIEGVTALPGLGRTYLRDAAGAVVAQEQIENPQVPIDAPGPYTKVTFRDGFTIEVHASETPLGPNADTDTGVTLADYIRIMASAAEENYNDFLDWGMQRSWLNAPTPYPHGGTSDIGIIYVNSAISNYCLACVWIRDDFQIHMHTAVLEALAALGYAYPGASDRDALSNVVGHEMFHNFQNAYGDPGRNSASTSRAFSEGTARMQETMHAYSHISHQPQSLVYAGDINGCNGWDGNDRDAAFAAGPLQTRGAYDACYFWLTYQGGRGTTAIVDLLRAMGSHIKVADTTEEGFAAMAQATGDVLPDLVNFAASSLTGKGYTWEQGDGTGTPIDWSTHLERWDVPTLNVGGEAGATLANGGMLGREVLAAGVPTLVSGVAELAVVRFDGEGVVTQVLQPGTVVPAPAPGERVWVLAVHPSPGSSSVRVSYAPPPA